MLASFPWREVFRENLVRRRNASTAASTARIADIAEAERALEVVKKDDGYEEEADDDREDHGVDGGQLSVVSCCA